MVLGLKWVFCWLAGWLVLIQQRLVILLKGFAISYTELIFLLLWSSPKSTLYEMDSYTHTRMHPLDSIENLWP